ncbi:MAG TPA: excinuclease ABC subunit UvrA [Kiritimatiellia bacterium]|nr:excinuclease ABC subunit UvrA [Kiritimatiellia bacterium]HRZ12916.1 excinuclease ABC subunit UvrA [Kiritimatiellia bacterium]HSA18474.1 excinuclease ABC subunit UvrA [Kiritimatiellia bacterium]
MSTDHILVAGAREHNLKDITVRIPRNALTVVTGLSGSGKSSLAFDTLYAEGQRKYVESLSAYARQFLEQMQKPEVDHIEGLSPAIAIEQRTAGANPRSIVATTTEIHDYLRLLYASVGHAHCWKCGRPISRQSAEEIVEQLLKLPPNTRLTLLAPLIRGRKGQHEEVLEAARKQGFVRARVNGEMIELDQAPDLDKRKKHTIEVVVDRLVLNDKIRARLTDSVELALKQGEGLLQALYPAADGKTVEQLYSEKHACPHCELSFDALTARHFSFNSPYGACPTCLGLGTMLVFDEDLIVPDPNLTLDEGAVRAWKGGGRRTAIYYKGLLRAITRHGQIDMETKYRDLPESFREILLHGTGEEEVEFGFWRGGAYHKYRKPFEGVIPNLRRRYEQTDSDYMRQKLAGFMSRQPCTACRGARLRPEAMACLVGDQSIVDVTRMSIKRALEFFSALPLTEQEQKIAREVIKEIRERLTFLVDVGLDYLTLDRESGSLSGGEAQRIRLATQVGAGLVGVLYVLDEPSIGLHQRDNRKLIDTLLGLRDLGNTVVVVEHDEQTILSADHVIDLGPGAGRHGGEVVFAGSVPELMKSPQSLTAKYLRKEVEIHVPRVRHAPPGEWLEIQGAAENNLKNINVRIPLGLLVCVTGVSGSGKSTLVDEILRRALFRRFYGSRERPGRHKKITGMEYLDKVIVIDQSPIGRTPRSNPATYTGAFSLIRDLFAQLPASRVRGYGPGRYSFNVKGGRCERCKGDGILRIEMHFLPDVYVTCEQCRGQRYNRETLEVRYRGKNIAEILALTIDEAVEFFQPIPRLARKLVTLSEVGLGYLQLGQPATTLSGGEAQRVKLSAELSRQDTGRTLYLLDEPTTGLHFADVHRLLKVLERLRDAGNTLVVIEHNLDVIKTADYVIDLGPEGGDAGGEIVACGTPEELVASPASHTGKYLAEAMGLKK